MRSEVFLLLSRSGGWAVFVVRCLERWRAAVHAGLRCAIGMPQKFLAGCLAVVARGRRGELWQLAFSWGFSVPGAGNSARQVKWLEFVALCDRPAVCARVEVFGGAKS